MPTQDHRRPEPVRGFTGRFFFLSNFFPCSVVHEGWRFRSAEHAFQAAKTLDVLARTAIQASPTPGQAKRMGRRVQLRSDWDDIRLEVMQAVIAAKFRSSDSLRYQLVESYPRPLFEENDWGDTFWGTVNGRGQNRLGRILMTERSRLVRIARPRNVRDRVLL